MFDTLIVQPIFNLLVLIYSLIPGHNFGLAVILFTIVIRFLMWPLVKKQLHHAKAIRELQPAVKKIKEKAAGDKRKQQQLTMELYKEREVNPLASIGIIIVQGIILIGLFFSLRKVIEDPQQLISFSYSPLHNLPWLETLAKDIKNFDATLFGVIDLTRTSVNPVYWPAMLLVIGSAITQFFQGRQLMPKTEDARGLRQILKDAGQGKTAEQQEVSMAVGRSTMYVLPLIVFVISINFAAALPLYWFTGSLVAIWQQGIILRRDVQEVTALAEKPTAKSTAAAKAAEEPKKAKTKKPHSKINKRR